ncbi:1086_t:CDS:1, partial [Acaulospora colombiana]
MTRFQHDHNKYEACKNYNCTENKSTPSAYGPTGRNNKIPCVRIDVQHVPVKMSPNTVEPELGTLCPFQLRWNVK